MKALGNIKIGPKLVGAFVIVALIAAVIGMMGYASLNTLERHIEEVGMVRMPSVQALLIISEAHTAIKAGERGLLNRRMSETEVRQAQYDDIDEAWAWADEAWRNYEPLPHTDEEARVWQQFKPAWEEWKRNHAAVRELMEQKDRLLASGIPLDDPRIAELDAEAFAISLERGEPSFLAAEALINQLVDINKKVSDTAVAEAHAAAKSSQTVSLAVMTIGVLLALAFGIILAQSITRPLAQVTAVSQHVANVDLQTLVGEMAAMASGDLTRRYAVTAEPLDISSKDEIGQMAAAFNAMIGRLQETGRSFDDMATNLRDLIGQVQDNALQVASASQQINGASEQTSQASQQVAATIQQVAQGTAQQAQAITQATSQVDQMAQAIDGIAKGAQEQAHAVERASTSAARMSAAIEQVAANAQESAEASDSAANSARRGADTVSQTVQAMTTIKATVTDVGGKVQQMQEHSSQIGAIVETIDDIAEQTNLLALNAAIEAARAGEQGRGFAVVADEVRKLAERSSLATKEIASLIRSVQTGIEEAVGAMGASLQQVESGANLAAEAGAALQEILDASQRVRAQVQQIAGAAQEMTAASSELVGAMDSVSAVVEENTAAAEESAASSGEISSAMEHVASVSEENSAAAEEVSAMTEEMNAQAEELTASAQSLAAMSEVLQQLVARFKLGDTDGADNAPTGSPKGKGTALARKAEATTHPQPQMQATPHHEAAPAMGGNGWR